MRRRKFLNCIRVGFFLWLLSSGRLTQATSDTDNEEGEVVVSNNTDDLVEENPNYVSPSQAEGRQSDDEDEAEDAKAAIKGALGKSRKKHRKAPAPPAILRKLHKHRVEITIAVVLFAFRREIARLIWHFMSKPFRDPKTGKVRPTHIPVTSILKIVIFIDVMRRLQSNKSPFFAALMAGGQGSPVLAMILSKIFSPAAQIYIPPVTQHFTFERVNDRYKKDLMALQKAINSSKGTWLGSNATTLSSWLQDGDDSGEYTETAIVMDLTNMDMSASRLEVLRDEVTFLLTEYGAHRVKERQDKPEIVVLLESAGGNAADYALVSQQILRMRNQGLQVTVCVDKVAASGTSSTLAVGDLYFSCNF
jgi:hypothetical protein